MRLLLRKLPNFALLAVYGGVAVLGYGLHELSSVDHHHHGMTAVPCAAHSGHHHDHGPAPAGACLGNLHECDVCEFLSQIRSEQPQLYAADVWQHLVAAVTFTVPQSCSQTTLGLHAPRGPPVFVG
jgi:hypothetical protein